MTTQCPYPGEGNEQDVSDGCPTSVGCSGSHCAAVGSGQFRIGLPIGYQKQRIPRGECRSRLFRRVASQKNGRNEADFIMDRISQFLSFPLYQTEVVREGGR